MLELKSAKTALRTHYAALRREMDPEMHKFRDKKICRLFLSLITYRCASTLLLYAPVRGEIDITPIALRALADGKRIAYPRCGSLPGEMEFHLVTDLAQLEEGTFHLPEPSETLPRLDPQREGKDAVCVLPALAYDRDGYRLGYGKGYYDRYLTRFPGRRVGLIYSDFLTEKLPRGRYDLPVDLLITEKGVRVLRDKH